MGRPLPPWTKINKGDRRPTERVIVSYTWEEPDFVTGETIERWGVTGAYWNPKAQKWVADNGRPVGKVTHWMPMLGQPQNEE